VVSDYPPGIVKNIVAFLWVRVIGLIDVAGPGLLPSFMALIEDRLWIRYLGFMNCLVLIIYLLCSG